MKTARMLIAVLFLLMLSNAQSQTTRTKVYKGKIFPQVTISPFGGAIFPVGVLGDNFKPGGQVGLDLGYRVNKEVGFYGKFGYYFMNSKLTGAR